MTSSCALAATTAASTSASRTPAPLPRFAALGVPPGPARLQGSQPHLSSEEGETQLRPCRAGCPVPVGGGLGKAGPSPSCPSPQLTHLFDNEGTVLFAIFMALWGESLRAPVGAA